MTGRTRRLCGRLLVGIAVAPIALVGLGASPVSAHPLGNFSVNHLNTLSFTGDQVVDDVVIDLAEIPTAQDRPDVDVDGDGAVSAAELAEHGERQCVAFIDAARLTVDGAEVALALDGSSYTYEAGQAGLETSRLECRLVAGVDQRIDTDVSPDPAHRAIEFTDDYRPGRVGWHEINATEQGSSIIGSPVPTSSVTRGLRSYPVDLLESPLNVRTMRFDVEFGTGATTDSAMRSDGAPPSTRDTVLDPRDSLVASRPGALGGFVDGVQVRFEDMIGRQDLTLGIGLLAIGLALVLGASHALLPGHGKTVMAAYIAGRQGSVRDAVLVGMTVTATHTGGVLLLGLGLTISTSLAGDTVLGWLGVVSGGLVAALGLALLISAIRHRGTGSPLFGHGHTHGPHGHTHAPAGEISLGASRDHHQDHASALRTDDAVSDGNVLVLVRVSTVDHDHHDHHDHHGHDHDGQGQGHDDDHDGHDHNHDGHGHNHDHDDHDHDHDHNHHDHSHQQQVSRRGLLGMGVAGGLVPSPSALIVLLSAIALGRTWFGIVLVVGYGVGMAATLTAAGILLVKVRDRFAERLAGAGGRASTFARRWGVAMPYLTAALVLVVGIGLAVRSLTSV